MIGLCLRVLPLVLLSVIGSAARATAPTEAVASSGPVAPPSTGRPADVSRRALSWIPVPKIAGRLTSAQLGLVINTADPYSVEVGEFYIKARHLAPAQVLRLDLPVRPSLSADEFNGFAAKVKAYFGAPIEALALAWTVPYAVGCNSITGALALGLDDRLCSQVCSPSKPSPYFDRPVAKPYTELHLRLSMLLAARDVAAAKAMIERGVAADHSLGLRGGIPANAWFVDTDDTVRSTRTPLFPPPGDFPSAGVQLHVVHTEAVEGVDRVLLYMTGRAQVDKLATLHWVPGGVGDHLTSFGGQLTGGAGQMSILDWIDSGATASYGTVSEPCAHPQKFPHPQVMLLNYLQGATVLEAYWRSVAWPQQGVFIGEPLAAPFARR